MGFDKPSNYNKIFYCSIRGKAEEYPYFKVEVKNEEGEGYKELPNEKSISGMLKECYIRNWEWKGKPRHSICVDIVDDPAILFKVSADVDSRMGRELLNRLITLGDHNFESGKIRIKPFETEAQEGYDSGFKGVSVQIAGQVVKNKFKYNDLKDKTRKVEVKKGEFSYDNTECNEFLMRNFLVALDEMRVRFPDTDFGAVEQKDKAEQPESQYESQYESQDDVDPKQKEADAIAATLNNPSDMEGPEPDDPDEKDDLPF